MAAILEHFKKTPYYFIIYKLQKICRKEKHLWQDILDLLIKNQEDLDFLL